MQSEHGTRLSGKNDFRSMLVLLALGCSLAGCSGGGGISGPLPGMNVASAATLAPVASSTSKAASAAGATPIASNETLLPGSIAPAAALPSSSPVAAASASATATAPANIAPAPPAATAAPAATLAPAPVVTQPPAQVVLGGAPTAPPVGLYPVYSSYFTGKTPFHDTVAQLMSAGATVLSPTIAQNYWNQGISQATNPTAATDGMGPMYNVSFGDPGYTFSCPTYGMCDASGRIVHYPFGAAPAAETDRHLISFDDIYAHGEVDGWGGDGTNTCALTPGTGLNPGTAKCSWGGYYPFSGSGLATDYSSGDASGYAYGLMDVSAQELLNGHIDHALGLIGSCLDNGGVYPANLGRNSDSLCPANLEPNAKYGDMIHVKSSVDVTKYGYSPYCLTIVRALQTYGAYTADNNGGYGIGLEMEYPKNPAYITDPWFTAIYPSMVAGGDGSGFGSGFRFQTCLQRIPASDIEVIQISQNLP